MPENIDDMSKAEVIDFVDFDSKNLSAIVEEKSHIDGQALLNQNSSIASSNLSSCQNESYCKHSNYKYDYKTLSFSFGKYEDQDDTWQKEFIKVNSNTDSVE